MTAIVMRYVPLVMSIPIFPPCRELLRENDPEMKRNFVKFRLETGQHQIHRKLPKGQCRFLNVVETSESVSGNMMNGNPSDMELSLDGPCFH